MDLISCSKFVGHDFNNELNHTNVRESLLTNGEPAGDEHRVKRERFTENTWYLNMVTVTKVREDDEKDHGIIDPFKKLNNIVLTTQLDNKSTQNNPLSVCLPTERNVTGDAINAYSCSRCPESFLTSDDFETHLKCHKEETRVFKQTSNGKQYSCSHCFKSFSTLTDFIVHQQIHRGEAGTERPFGCSQCGKRFYREDGLKTHQQNHAREKLHPCSQCGKSFVKKSLLTSHLRTHVKEGPYHCTACGQNFVAKRSYEQHMQIHVGQKFSCFHCGKTFLTEYSLNKHKHKMCGRSSLGLSKQTSLKKKSYCCSHCGKTFALLSHFMVHCQIHKEGKGERPFRCTQCGKAFYKEKGLKTHEQNHIVKTVPPCSDCGKLLISKQNVTGTQSVCADEAHVKCCRFDRSHVGECQGIHPELKPYACSRCGRSFATDLILQQHLESHKTVMAHHFRLQDPDLCGQNHSRNSALPENVECKKKALAVINVGLNFVFTNSKSLTAEEQRSQEGDVVGSGDSCASVGQKVTASSAVQDDEKQRRHCGEIPHNWLKNGEAQKEPETVSVDFCKEKLEYDFSPKCCLKSEPKLLDEVKMEYSTVEKDRQPRLITLDNRTVEEMDSGGHSLMKEMATKITGKDTSAKEEDTFVEKLKNTPQSEGICTPLLNLVAHKQIYTEENLYQDLDCARKHLKRVDPVTYQKDETNEKVRPHQPGPTRKQPYCCIKCGRAFNSTTNYIVHLQIHRRDGKEERPFSCPQCGKSFYKEEGLKKHQLSHTVRRARPLSGKALATRSASGHRYPQTGERLYSSTKCIGSLAVKSYFRKCMAVHQGKKLCICSSNSGLKKPKTALLRERSSSAEGKKSYCCSHCGKTFGVLTNYIVHQQIHRGEGKAERPFACLVCGKRFYREQGLKSHQETHTSERPSRRPQHDKTSRQRDSVDHAQSQAGGGRLSCFCCKETFRTDSSLIRHLKHHSLEFKDPDFGPGGGEAVGQSQSDWSRRANPAPVDEAETKAFSLQTCSMAQPLRTTMLDLGQSTETEFGSRQTPGKCGKTSPVSSDRNSQKCDVKLALTVQHSPKAQLREIKEEDSGQMFLSDADVEDQSLLKIIKIEDLKMVEAVGELGQINPEKYNGPHSHRRTYIISGGGSVPAEKKPCPYVTQSKEDDQRSHLQSHLKPASHKGHIPQGQKTYCCTQCGKRFATTTSYLVHLQIHKGKRPFSCSQCGKSYYKENSLQAHQQTHRAGV